MRTPTGAGRPGRVVANALLAGVLAATTGCATLRATFAGYATGRDGITRPQQRLREALVNQDFATALAWKEDDALLQSLTTGVAAYYAKQFTRSASVLDTAALLADDRITASLSKNGLSFVTNDMARPYQPRRTERLFIPYYAMLSYVQLGAWEDAAVEARRLVSLLDQFGDERDDAELAVHGAMQHLAGAVFERAGEANDARVAYRAAHAFSAPLPERISRGTIADDGELLLVVERGFVAHRATETIELELGDDHHHDSHHHDDDGGRRHAAEPSAERATGRVRPLGGGPAVSTVSTASTESTVPSAGSHEESGTFAPPHRHHHDDDDDDYHLTVAFPTLRRSARPWGGDVRLVVDDGAVEGFSVSAIVDDATAVDERRERVAMATRAAARAAAKYAVTKAIKDNKGEVAGSIANFGASLLERADVRSWHLLPQEISLVRVRVPAGTRTVRVQVGDGWAVRTVEVGSVVVKQGEVTIIPVRLWRDPAPMPAPTPPVVAEVAACATFFCP